MQCHSNFHLNCTVKNVENYVKNCCKPKKYDKTSSNLVVKVPLMCWLQLPRKGQILHYFAIKKHLSTSRSPHCQVTPPNCQIADSISSSGMAEYSSNCRIFFFLQAALWRRFFPFLLKFMPQKRSSFNFHLLTNSKKGSIVFFFKHGDKL